MKIPTNSNNTQAVATSIRWARGAGLAAMLTAPQQASAEEPATVDSAFECDRLADLFDVANSECPAVEACSDLPEEAVDRTFRGRSHAKCASRYDDFLDLAQTCKIKIDRDLRFDTLMRMLQHRKSAYECTHRYNRDIAPALDRIYLELEDLRKNTDERAQEHLQQLSNLRIELSQIRPPPPKVAALKTTVAQNPKAMTGPPERSQKHAPPRPLRLIDHFTLRVNIGGGGVIVLAMHESNDLAAGSPYSTYRTNIAFVANFSAGARFPIGNAHRHIIGTGLTYTLMAGNLTSKGEWDPHGINTAKFPGVHHLGPYARYGYRAHRDHFTPYLEISGGLQGFSFGSQFFTPFGQGALGACSLWQTLCLTAGYLHGWGGPRGN